MAATVNNPRRSLALSAEGKKKAIISQMIIGVQIITEEEESYLKPDTKAAKDPEMTVSLPKSRSKTP